MYLAIRLHGQLQSWATSSSHIARGTDPWPSFSGVAGMALACLGVPRERAADQLAAIAALRFDVRVDLPGSPYLDFQTQTPRLADASRRHRGTALPTLRVDGRWNHGTVVSTHAFLADASFVAILSGDDHVLLRHLADALARPRWQPYLGKKGCLPSAPLLVSLDSHPGPREAASAVPWIHDLWDPPPALPVVLHEDGPGSFPVNDVPASLCPHVCRTRTVRLDSVQLAVQPPARTAPARRVDYDNPHFRYVRLLRFDQTGRRCVICGDKADEGDHNSYANAPLERPEEVDPLCRPCHFAVTQIENASERRLDAKDPDVQAAVVSWKLFHHMPENLAR